MMYLLLWQRMAYRNLDAIWCVTITLTITPVGHALVSLLISLIVTGTPLIFCHINTPPARRVTTMYVIMSVNRFSKGT